jgi:hypothetical protein
MLDEEEKDEEYIKETEVKFTCYNNHPMEKVTTIIEE